MKTFSLQQLLFCSLILFFYSFSAYSSPALQDFIKIETKDMDGDTATNWMRLHIKLTNTGDYMIDLKGIELRYFYTDNNANLVDSNSTPVWWFNTHSPDWQYNFGSTGDVWIRSIPPDPAHGLPYATIFIRFDEGLLYPNGGEANLQFGAHKTDWANFYETDDPSYIKTIEFVVNGNVKAKSKPYTAAQLSDMRVFFNADSQATNDLLLTMTNSHPGLLRNRELMALDPNNVDVGNPLTLTDYERALFTHTFDFYKSVLPEINYRKVTNNTDASFRINLIRGGDQTDGGWGGTGGFTWCTNPGYDIDSVWNDSLGQWVPNPYLHAMFYQTVTSNQFVDRNQTYEKGIFAFLGNYNSVVDKQNHLQYRWHGYRLGYGGRHEFGHGVGLSGHPDSTWEFNSINGEKESVMHQSDNRAYNDDIVRIYDVAYLSNWRDFPTGQFYLISYPYIAKFITMENYPDSITFPNTKRNYYTNNYYDARYRMYETQYNSNLALPHPSRFYVLHYDSVMVSTYADENDLRSGAPTQFEYPLGLFVDNDALAGEVGAIYVGVWAQVRRIDRFGNVTIYAGTGNIGYANGPRLTAQFDHHISPLVTDASGNIYVCENIQNRIRKIDRATGQVSLLAGSSAFPGGAGYVNGTGSTARFSTPSSLAYDNVNNVIYVADRNNNAIRRITMAGVVTTYISSGVSFPTGLAIDNIRRRLYVSEWGTNAHAIKMINLTNASVTTIAGSTASGFTDGIGTDARFNTISDIDVDEQGNIWVADGGNRAIRYIIRSYRTGGIDYTVYTIAGNGTLGSTGGSGTYSRFNNVVDVSCDRKGNVFITDQDNKNIRKLSWVLPITMNAPRMGNRLDSLYDANYYTFTNLASGRRIIEVNTSYLCNNVNLELFGPDDEYNLHFSDMNGGNALFDNTLPAGRYLVRVTTNRTPTQRPGAYSIRVHDGRDLLVNGITQGNIEFEGDNDWYSFNVTTAGNYTIEASDIASSLNDTVHLYLYTKNPFLNANNQATVLPDSLCVEGDNTLTRTLDTRFYWVRVRSTYDLVNNSDFIGTYSILARRN